MCLYFPYLYLIIWLNCIKIFDNDYMKLNKNPQLNSTGSLLDTAFSYIPLWKLQSCWIELEGQITLNL